MTEIELGGKKRKILFGFEALYDYEMMTGRAALSDFFKIQAGEMKISVIADLTVAGLKNADPGFSETPRQVAIWLFSQEEAIKEVMDAFQKSFPEGKKKET